MRTALNLALREHVYLAAATNAALGGRNAEFEAAAAALDGNSVDVAAAIGTVYGPEAGKAFLPLWRKHIGFVVDYTVGAASKDKAKQDKAVADLVAYTEDFGAFLASANPNLPKDVVADLVKHHVLTLKDVIDPQAAGDQAKAYVACAAPPATRARSRNRWPRPSPSSTPPASRATRAQAAGFSASCQVRAAGGGRGGGRGDSSSDHRRLRTGHPCRRSHSLAAVSSTRGREGVGGRLAPIRIDCPITVAPGAARPGFRI